MAMIVAELVLIFQAIAVLTSFSCRLCEFNYESTEGLVVFTIVLEFKHVWLIAHAVRESVNIFLLVLTVM